MESTNQKIKLTNQKNKKLKLKQPILESSLKGSSDCNDDSLDKIDNQSHFFDNNQSRLNTSKTVKRNQYINQIKIKQLRSCIRNQFKKTNFLNLSALKNDQMRQLQKNKVEKHYINQSSHINKKYKINQKQLKANTNSHQNHVTTPCIKLLKPFRRPFHNRSQSCPFIDPICIYDKTLSTKQNQKNQPSSAVSSHTKFQKHKKISIQQLQKKRKKRLTPKQTHNYSKSLTQSSNTVIVHHNLPQSNNIFCNQNVNHNELISIQENHLSSILYKTQNHQDNSRQNDDKDKNNFRKIKDRQAQQSLILKTQILQKIHYYTIKQQIQQIHKDKHKFQLKQLVLNKLINNSKHHDIKRLRTNKKQIYYQEEEGEQQRQHYLTIKS